MVPYIYDVGKEGGGGHDEYGEFKAILDVVEGGGEF